MDSCSMLPHPFDFGRSDIRKFRDAWTSVASDSAVNSREKQARFNPYSSEGGTVAAISGPDFVVFASDTRMSTAGFAVISRFQDKIYKLNDNVYQVSCGFNGDINQLIKVLRTRMRIYKFNFHEDMTVEAAAEMLARTMYYKRFFPYYTSTILGGLTSKGEGCLYSYDPVGTIERLPYAVSGSGEAMMEPFFDNQLGHATQSGSPPALTLQRAQSLMRDAFRSVTERETSTGDSLRMVTLQKGQAAVEEVLPLRLD